jgi:hypothetical protein
MEDTSIVIMERERETGFLGKELGSYNIGDNIEYIDRVYASLDGDKMRIYLYLTIPGDFNDSEFNAILDNYDTTIYEGNIISIEEDEENYNPGWIVEIDFIEDINSMEKAINNILSLHKEEVNRISIMEE